MPGAGGNSFTNNPVWDFVVHPAGSDDERGIPAVGKVVYRTDLSALQVCTATSPDATLNGGGTWAGTGGAYQAWPSIDAIQTAAVTVDAGSVARYRWDGAQLDVNANIEFTSAGTGGGLIAVGFPTTLTSPTAFACGSFLFYTGGATLAAEGTVIGYADGTAAVFTFIASAGPALLGSLVTIANTDTITFTATFEAV